MPNYRDSNGNCIPLDKQISNSGEGTIYKTNIGGFLVKIYHHPTPEKIEKLKVMIANPPEDPMGGENHISFAWPTDLVKDDQGKYVGFLMPEIRDSVQLIEYYNPQLRNKIYPHFNWYCLHITALNVASVIEALHKKGYIIGDMKSQNILVNKKGYVSVVDTDSFQVKNHKTGEVFRCPVGTEGFTPPELIGRNIQNITQTRSHDRFRLGVIIYHLLFTHHPFQGKYIGTGDPPGQDDSISKGYWPYSNNSLIKLGKYSFELDIVHPEVKKCFLRCFNDGHIEPSKRPHPKDWINALQIGIDELKVCSINNNHIYSNSYQKCYWCERFSRVSVDIFPSVSNPILPLAKINKEPEVIKVVKQPEKVIQYNNNGKIQPSSSPSIGIILFWVIVGIVLIIIIF